MAPRLSAETIAFIETALTESTPKPDFEAIALAFGTTAKSVRYIYARMGHKELYPNSNWKSKPGRTSKITPEVENAIQYIVQAMPFIYLDEISDFIQDCFDIQLHKGTVSKLLKRFEVTRKRLTVQAAQRELLLRQDYQFKIRGFTADQFVFVDESGSDVRTGDRRYGYAESGVQAVVKRWLQSRKRVSVLPAYTVEGYITSITFEGTCTGDMFEAFIIDHVLPKMRPFPESRSVLVMDNASIHHSNLPVIQAACDAKRVELIFLPPYSPDYNPIEESFADLKSFIRRSYRSHIGQFDSYQSYLEWAVKQTGTGDRGARKARGHFRNAGIQGVAANKAVKYVGRAGFV
jgi:transposase